MDKLSTQDRADWIRVLRPVPDPVLRLVCCPHAGASASALGPLARALPEHVEALVVDYPAGRGAPGKDGFASIPELADRVADGLGAHPDRSLAFFGHSMGSVVAFELARRAEAAGVEVAHLFVSGRRSPSAGLGVRTPLEDQAIADELIELGAVPARLLANAKFRRSILTVVRHDYRANSAYAAPPEAVLDSPVTFLLSDADPYVDAAAAQGWRQHTSGGFRIASFPGGHFFLTENLSRVVELIVTTIGDSHEHGQRRDRQQHPLP